MSTNAYEGILTKGYFSSLSNTPVDNGKIRIAIDTGQMFVDTNDERIPITDFVKMDTEESVRSVLAPLPKFYFANDTGRILIYNSEEWIIVSERNSSVVNKALTADSATKALTADKATNADTATYAETAGSATKATNADTATYSESSGSATKATNADTATYAETAGSANSATNASSATHATNADTAAYANSAKNASTATYATNASTAVYANSAKNASTANYAKTAGSADSATKATNADTAVYANSAKNANNATYDVNGNQINTTYAPLVSPIFTGKPNVPTAAEGTNDQQVANTAFVAKAIANAVGDIVNFKTEVVTSLPKTGVNGTIYFILNGTDENQNIYDEYMWINKKFELIGSTQIDLSGFINGISTSGTGNAVTGVSVENNKAILKKDATFLTAHPSVTTSSSTGTASPKAGDSLDIITSITKDSNGHVTNFVKKTVTLPNTVSKATNADTAVYANSAASATKATQDSSGNNINNYIKSVSASGRTLTFTRGNGSTFSFNTQDNNTTYTTYKGATTAANGTAGLVPPASTATRTRFLRGDGTWAVPTNTTYALVSTTANGLCPKRVVENTTYRNNGSTASIAKNFLRCDGTWAAPIASFIYEDADLDFGSLD